MWWDVERQRANASSVDRLADLLAKLQPGQRLEIPGPLSDALGHWRLRTSKPVVIAETQRRHYLEHSSLSEARRFDEAVIQSVASPEVIRQDKKYANRAVMYRRMGIGRWAIVILDVATSNQPVHKVRTVFFVPEQEVRRRRSLEPWVWGEEG